MRGQEADAVVAPVVAELPLQQVRVLDELVHRQQLDGGDAEIGQVVGDGGMSQAGVGAPQLLGDVGMALGQALDVGLVDDRLVQRTRPDGCRRPVEVATGDHALRHRRRRVGVVAPSRVVETVPEDVLAPLDLAVDGGGVGVEQQLGRVAAQPVAGRPRTVHPQAVALARATSGRNPCHMWAVRSGSSTRSSVPSSLNRQTSTASAISEDTATLAPSELTVTPNGNGWPFDDCMGRPYPWAVSATVGLSALGHCQMGVVTQIQSGLVG